MTITNTRETRAPSVASSATTVSVDEGGFNEPSPEIKAKLKPVYQFDIQSPPLPPSPPARNVIPPPIPMNDDLESPVDLNYVDVITTAPTILNGRSSSTVSSNTTLYASIKPEIPSPPEMLLEIEIKHEAKLLDMDDSSSGDTQIVVMRESSFIPMKAEFDPADDSSIAETDVGFPTTDKPLPQLPSLDLPDMEFADASEPEEEPNMKVDAMTADEAEKLLSSKWVKILFFFY